MRSRVTSRDGTSLAVSETGDRSAPTIVCVHGYPDNRSVWDGVVAELAAHAPESEGYHVVTYDVRGAGESDTPRHRSDYHLDRLAEDFAAVLDAVSPERPVHVLAHDWGSIQAWHAITDAQTRGRVASFTSISGPCLDHAAHWMRSRLRPNPRALRELVTQVACSGYIGFFSLPLIPELAWRAGLIGRWLRLLEPANPAPVLSDALNGLNLYRENMSGRFAAPHDRYTDVPVQVLAPRGDPFVGTPMQTGVHQWVANLHVRRIPGSHWIPRANPAAIARCATELVKHVEGEPRARGLSRARVGARRSGRFDDHLVAITGAGNGIGRATALAFADEGARLVISDIDADQAQHTAELAQDRGATADWSTVDVSDSAAVEAWAQRIEDEHGAPDIVINNAGIGMAGPFVDTTDEDWRRLIDINLHGVVHGCRSFADRMTRRGEGGRIVNVSSAAAYTHPQGLSAYAASKSAVLALSQGLRAELVKAGIAVVAVCPGIVDTGITARTRFVGLDDAEQERRRQDTSKMYRRRGFTPERAAREILRAIERDKTIAPVTPEAKVGLVLSRLTPRSLRALNRIDLTRR